MSDDISEPGKISKNYSEPIEAYWETIFDYSASETIPSITDFIAECISIRKKISKNYSKPFEAYWETIFDYSIPEVDQHRSKDMSDGISDSGKFPNNYIEPFEAYWETIFRLLQSRSESTSCERYAWWYIDPGKNSKIIPSYFVNILRLL